MIALIGSDGKRAYVRRAIATEASYVLRDLLDADDYAQTEKTQPNKPYNPLGLYKNDDSRGPTSKDSYTLNAFEENDGGSGCPNPSALPANGEVVETSPLTTAWGRGKPDNAGSPHPFRAQDPMDYLFGVQTKASGKHPSMGESPGGNPNDRNSNPSLSFDKLVLREASVGGGSAEADAVEVPFPYFPGAILARVCAHMTAHHRLVAIPGRALGVVERLRVRAIPRPMGLPLEEYLDPVDQALLRDWDEPTTVWMVKAATMLNYEALLELASAKLASYLCYKNIVAIRTLLHAENDFAPNEEAEIRKELENDVFG